MWEMKSYPESRTRWGSSAVAVLALLLSVLSPSLEAQQPAWTTLEGFWLSDGYGLLVEIRGKTLSTFELTAISCILSRTLTHQPELSAGGEVTFHEGATVVRIAPVGRDSARLHYDGNASDIVLHRSASRPEPCAQLPPNTPEENYAIFWQTFAENYAFFGLRHLDWQAVGRKFRPQATASTKPEDLFQVFRSMVEPLQDAHTEIDAGDIRQEFEGWRPDPNHLEDADWEKAHALVNSRYVQGGLRSFCNGHVEFGILPHNIGYLRITTFYGYSDQEGYSAALIALDQALDSIFQSAESLTGLIIDVRLNKGGDDPLGIEIASRLTTARYLAYSKIARNDAGSGLHFSSAQKCWVIPSKRSLYRGNVVLLTGPDTVSAGETFAMALMGREPAVTRIGEDTQGVFSDVLIRSLPNGWHFGLPNEIYLTRDGRSFDGEGVPPDIRVPRYSSDDLSRGRDAALDRAIAFLSPPS
ncbi:S41 family peptidase [Candidatus Sulfotelmatobacter kueseliae]|uniref:S41 family peptidase n=1 Tax=Candidatus Sulfotelmatobacter kueseliae TaxID=2042962 RepID=A0A2U3KI02_9BACT|nr:S41 family peptidase [Candidatus Sulfotelmatobacter kueseliae]